MKKKKIAYYFFLVIIFFSFLGCKQTILSKKEKELENHRKWLTSVMMEIQTIKVGMTREQLLKVFITEGGLSTYTWRTYVHRDCRYIKVNVNFNTINKNKESPKDIITKISKPYLQWSISD